MLQRDEVIRQALARAVSLVEEAEGAENSTDNSNYQLLVWKSAAEAEYVAFQISTTRGLLDYDPTSEVVSDRGQSSLVEARLLFLEAQNSLESDAREAYRNVRAAVTVLRRIYGSFGKAGQPAGDRLHRNG